MTPIPMSSAQTSENNMPIPHIQTEGNNVPITYS